jgi:hypothetical protein
LSRRLDAWVSVASLVLTHLERVGALAEAANIGIGHEGSEILQAMDALILPPSLRAELTTIRQRLGHVANVGTGNYIIANRLVTLVALRAPLDRELRTTEEPRRRLVDRAFLHLNRTLMVDDVVRERWKQALSFEPRCEQLGAVHLLSHGVFGFKADGGTGRTDLILGEPVRPNEEIESVDAMVLTEWKVARKNDAIAKAYEGRAQAERYAALELAGFELRRHRYIVVVSATPEAIPLAETIGGVTYHFVNVAVERASPSVESRKVVRATKKRALSTRAKP